MTTHKQKAHVPNAAQEPQDEAKWKKLYDSLSPEAKHTIETETAAIREDLTHGSKLRIGQHFARIRTVLAPNRKAASLQKENWSLYMKAHPFPGISRATGYRLMDAWGAAEKLFNPAFLDAFAASGFALGLNPSKASPLGKYTETAKGFKDAKANATPVDDDARKLVEQVAVEFTKNKPKPEKKTRREQEQKLHDSVLSSVAQIVKSFAKDGTEVKPTDYRDELDEVVARLYWAIGVDSKVTIEPKKASGFGKLELPTPQAEPPKADVQPVAATEPAPMQSVA